MMKMSKWRAALIGVSAVYAVLGCVSFLVTNTHAPFPFLPLNFDPNPSFVHNALLLVALWMHTLVWAFGFLILCAEGYWHTWVATFWFIDSVFLTLLFWSFVTLPIEYFMLRLHPVEGRNRRWWKELFGLLALALVVVGISAVVFNLYPPK